MTGGDRTYRENKHRDVDTTAIHPTITNYGSQKIEIETATFAAKIDRNRSFLEKSQSTQHYSHVIQTQALHHIRPSRTINAAKTVATSINRLIQDFCNSLLFGSTHRNLDHLH